MEEKQTVQPEATAAKPKRSPAEIRQLRRLRHAKVRKRMFQAYALILILVTGIFGYHLLDYFVLSHNETAGEPVFGNRLDYLDEIPQSIKDSAMRFGNGLPGIVSVDLDNRGAVIFLKVEVNGATEVSEAQESAEQIMEFFLEEAGSRTEGYNFQLVVTTGDSAELAQQNRQASIDHIYDHFYFLAEQTLSHAEEFPATDFIDRAQGNINIFANRFGSAAGTHRNNFRETTADKVAALQERLDAITPWTADEEEEQAERFNGTLPTVLQGTDRLIPPSNVSDFPSWGIINRDTGDVQWN